MRKRWPLIMTAVSLTFVSAACSAKETSGVQEVKKEAKNVEVATVNKEMLDVISNLSGTLLPYDETVVSFEVGGRIIDMSAKIGDSIKKGSVLTRLDPTEYRLQVEKANKTILEAQAALNSSDAAIQSADAGVQSADAGIQSADAGIQTADGGIQTADEAIKSAEANIKAANSCIHSVQASLEELNKGAREQEKTQARLAVERAKDAYNKVSADAGRMKGLYEEGLVSKKEYEEVQLQLSNAQKDVANAEQSLSLLLEGATEEKRKQVYASLEEAQAGKEQAEAGKGQSVAAKGQSVASKGQAMASKEQAMASKEQAIASKQQAVAAKGQSQAAYEQALVGKELTEFTLSKTVLKAPISGVVLEKLVSNGQMVNAGTSVYRLGRTDQLKVLLPVLDKEIKDWKVGQEVNVALYDQVKEGKVNKIYPLTNASTGTISVEVVIPNTKFDWFPGQVVKANRVSSDNSGILVPVEAVISNGDKPYVFKAVNGKAVKTVVETGELINNKIHIINGLKEGDKVVTLGADLLFDGDPVKTAGGKKE
ncbi:efflux RND transporter periplasmic adaptor subunit [Bacillus songklensis]|uniref:Efflux RND transporter periplasmic adaptor subunit n=1 Tax=Bacillus songklensis TaxID=1069116 RepID=A0ABV8AYP4_9BACI